MGSAGLAERGSIKVKAERRILTSNIGASPWSGSRIASIIQRDLINQVFRVLFRSN